MFWKAITACFDFFVGSLDLGCLEWRFSDKESVNNDSNRPDINFIRMSLAFENLRGYVVGSSAYSFLLFLVVFETSGQAEVTELDFHIFVEEQVTELKTILDEHITLCG